MKRPEWARFEVRLYFSRCWLGEDENGVPTAQGVTTFHDFLLRYVDVPIHQWFIQPFFREEGFPFRILKEYE